MRFRPQSFIAGACGRPWPRVISVPLTLPIGWCDRVRRFGRPTRPWASWSGKLRNAELPEEILAHADSRLSGPELHQVLDASVAVERRRVLGGPARERVLEALISARALWSKGTEAR